MKKNWSLFLWALWRKKKTDKNDHKYILFRIGIYFTKYFLAIEIDEKGHTDREITFEEKNTRSVRKKT